MTKRERFIEALERRPITGLVPHFELVFFLTMEKFGEVHVSHRNYEQWNQMSETERNLHRNEMVDQYIKTAEAYNHSAIFIHPNPFTVEEITKTIDLIREKTDDEYFIMMHGDATFGIPSGDEMVDFIYRIADDPESVKAEAEAMLNTALERAAILKEHGGLDGFALCADYCFNEGCFLSPGMMDEFVFPYLKRLIAEYRKMGFYTIKHTDGNIMPILDQLADCDPHALHSIDPQGGVDIAEVKKLIGDRICLIGGVNCGLLQTGTDEEARATVEYALEKGMPGGGYIFSTSNCVYTGMPLERYEMMIDIWKEKGSYGS